MGQNLKLVRSGQSTISIHWKATTSHFLLEDVMVKGTEGIAQIGIYMLNDTENWVHTQI